MPNPYEQFDPSPPAPNPYERFDIVPASEGQPVRITVRPSPQGPVENAIAPITNLPSTYAEMVRHGLQGASEGAGQVVNALSGPISTPGTNELERAIQGIQQGKNIDYAVQQAQEPPTQEKAFGPIPITERLKAVKDILGGAFRSVAGGSEYVSAPLLAPIQSLFSQPVENITGLPKEYTNFAATLALPIPKNIPGVARAPESFIPIRPVAPSVEMLRTEARRNYNAPEVVNAPMMPPQAATQLGQQIMFDLAKGRTTDVTAKSVYDLVGKLERPPPGSPGFTVENIETLRQQLGELGPIKDGTGRVVNKPELRAAQIARSRIDEFLRQNAPEAATTLERARGNFGAAESADIINRKQFVAELRAAAAHSGQNVTNTMRQRITDILVNPNQKRGFSRAELMLMENIVHGTTGENIVRGAGKVLGGGGGIGMLHSGSVGGTAGALIGGPVGAAIGGTVAPALGYGLNKLSNMMTVSNIERLNQIIRSDSPLGRQLHTPLSDWNAAQEAFAAAPTARNRARFTIASRNLSNNLSDAGIQVSPNRLIGGTGMAPASQDQE